MSYAPARQYRNTEMAETISILYSDADLTVQSNDSQVMRTLWTCIIHGDPESHYY